MKNITIKLFAVCVLIALSSVIFAQTEPPSDLTGSALRTWLKTNWYDGYHNTLGYDNAREQMYGYIDKKTDGQVYCVYTGFHQAGAYDTYLDPINAEHTIPQSWFGEDEPMKSDLFHLYPTHEGVNGVRSNYPFAELTDAQTDYWYTVNSNNTGYVELTSAPSSNADAYSKFNSGSSFEPKANHKGDVARSAFYFYTVYPTQAGSITDLCNLNTLYQWHLADPVDAWELQRNDKIEQEQGNRNPYIDYPEIACRAWGIQCETAIETPEIETSVLVYPNPASEFVNIEFYLSELNTISIDIYDITGRKVASVIENQELSGSQSISWNFNSENNFENGIYFINLKTENYSTFEKIIYNK